MSEHRDVIFILYVANQNRSRDFYQHVLESDPQLDVEGMTEFYINDSAILGLMPETGIARLLGDTMPNPATAMGIPRCELYMLVDNPMACFNRAIEVNAKIISPPATRNWGDFVAYIADPDGHIIALK